MHVLINVKSSNNISKWQMGFNSAFKGLNLCHLTWRTVSVLMSESINSFYIRFATHNSEISFYCVFVTFVNKDKTFYRKYRCTTTVTFKKVYIHECNISFVLPPKRELTVIDISEVCMTVCFVSLTKEDLIIPICQHVNMFISSFIGIRQLALSSLTKTNNTSAIRKWGKAKLLHTLPYEL
jgi:hypothetical protein